VTKQKKKQSDKINTKHNKVEETEETQKHTCTTTKEGHTNENAKYIIPAKRMHANAANQAQTRSNMETSKIIYDETQGTIEQFLQTWNVETLLTRNASGLCINVQAQPDERVIQQIMSKFDELDDVTEEAIDQIAREHEFLYGKWIIHASKANVSREWSLIAHSFFKTGCKISMRNEIDEYAIYVYIDDYLNSKRVFECRHALWHLGFRTPIGLKPEIYTMLGIYSHNSLGIRPSRYKS